MARTRMVFFLALSACGSSSSSPDNASDAATDGSHDAPRDAAADAAMPDAGGDGGGADAGCVRSAKSADRARKLVLSHPFTTAGGKATAFEVLDLAVDGTLTRPSTPVTFAMGTALNSPIVFTPDGEIGLVAQDDGSVGVFRVDAAGKLTVLNAAFRQTFFADAVVMSPDGSRAYVIDPDTASNHGGVYELGIGCDGEITSRGIVVPGGTAHAMAFFPNDPRRALLSGGAAFDSPSGQDAHVLDMAGLARVGSAVAFGDVNDIASSVAVMPDGKYALIADNAATAGSRVAVVALSPMIAPVSILSTPFPAAVVASPFNNAAIVLNDDSTDQIHVMRYDPSNSAAPFTITGELAYRFGKPQIPTNASVLDRGALKGKVFVGENVAVRVLTFTAAGDVVDTAKLEFAGGNESIVGVVGVQP